ncbi:MAG: pilin [Clostridium sp.]|nr:pilin [Clostridium sp.]MCM1443856.1 pilin [Candidatus Amulumruptor caecigallinarius]
MKKRIVYFFITTFFLTVFISNVSADSIVKAELPKILANSEEICAKGLYNNTGTQGAASNWNFSIFKMKTKVGDYNKDDYIYIINMSPTTICDSSSDCAYHSVSAIGKLVNISNEPYFDIIGSENGGMTIAQVQSEIGTNNKCPNFVYAGASPKSSNNKKAAFIFSNKEIKNTMDIFEKNGYVGFLEDGITPDENKETLFKQQVNVMKSYIEKYKSGKWNETYNSDCNRTNYFGKNMHSSNNQLDKYRELKSKLPSTYSTKDADIVYDEYKSLVGTCAIKQGPNSSTENNTNTTTNFSGKLIDDKTQEIIDWALNLIRIVGIILMIVLGMLDFIKATAAGNEEQVSKAKSSFVKRLIACVVLFILPFIVNILIDIVNNANGSDVIEKVAYK